MVQYLVEQRAAKGRIYEGGKTPLTASSDSCHVEVVRYLVKQGTNIEKTTGYNGWSLLTIACISGHLNDCLHLGPLELLEEGTNRDTVAYAGYTPPHLAAGHDHLEIFNDLNARTDNGELPIDNEEIKQAICDEPRRRMDHASHRARPTSQNSHISFCTTVMVRTIE